LGVGGAEPELRGEGDRAVLIRTLLTDDESRPRGDTVRPHAVGVIVVDRSGVGVHHLAVKPLLVGQVRVSTHPPAQDDAGGIREGGKVLAVKIDLRHR